MEQHCPIKCTSSLFERESFIPQWVFKLNSTLAAAKTWQLKGRMQKVNVTTAYLDSPSEDT